MPNQAHLVLGFPSPVADVYLRQSHALGHSLITVAPAGTSKLLPKGVELVVGEPTSIDFGLSGEDYKLLLGRVGQLSIAEQSTRSIADVEQSRSVRMAAEACEFVRAGGAPQGVRLLSSLLVFGDAQGAVSEEDFFVGQKFAVREEEALAVAEKLVREVAHLRPVAVVRCAPLVGDEETSTLYDDSSFSRLARQIQTAPEDLACSFSDLPVRIETVQRAARALLMAQPAPLARTYHLVDAEPLTDRALMLWLAERAQRRISEAPGAASVWSNWLAQSAGDSRVVRGWGLRFARANAERDLRPLLDRDQLLVLSSLFRPGEAS